MLRLSVLFLPIILSLASYKLERAVPEVRKKRIDALDNLIKDVLAVIEDEKLARMFEVNFPLTLDLLAFDMDDKKISISSEVNQSTMKLNEAPLQILPYLKLFPNDTEVQEVARGLITRIMSCIFKNRYSSQCKPTGLVNNKFSLSSYAAPLYLMAEYLELTGDYSLVEDKFVKLGLETIKQVLSEQQHRAAYSYSELSEDAELMLSEGMGPNGRWPGLIRSGFRPSGEAMVLPFSIPENLIILKSLKVFKEIRETKFINVLSDIQPIISGLEAALKNNLHVTWNQNQTVLALETDGYGNFYLGDDANLPNLLSLSYFDCVPSTVSQELYNNSRLKNLDWEGNPFFYKTAHLEGLGSLESLGELKVMSAGVIMQALTSGDDEEITTCLQYLKRMTDGHLLVWRQNAKTLEKSLELSGLSSALFGELIVKLSRERPHLLK